MFDTERAINAAAVVTRLTSTVMMIFTKVSCATKIKGFSTAFVTLPSYIFMAMNWAVVLSSTHLFHSASFANKVLLFSRFCHLQVTFTLDLSAVIRLLARMTLVKS